MPRVLTCIDPVPATDGSCAETVFQDFSGGIPPLPVDTALELSGLLIGLFATAWCWKALRRFINPKMG